MKTAEHLKNWRLLLIATNFLTVRDYVLFANFGTYARMRHSIACILHKRRATRNEPEEGMKC